MAQTYSYSALPTQGHIRLLTLKASKSTSADLHGELVDYPLQECEGDLHCYEALSYVWGSNEKPRHIWIGNRKLDITESLSAALLRLRTRYADRSLWVDAICINQADDDEKSIQVQRMAAVYNRASRVRVWLGEAEAADGSGNALDCLAEAGAAEGPYELPDESLEPIRNLLARDWFKRVWVLQEVAAAQHVVIMCGATSIDGYAFCVGLQALHKSDKLPDLQEHIGSIVYLIRRSIFRLGTQNRQTSQEGSPTFSLNIQPLGQLIDMYRNRQATDQRDKVYALLGMCSEDIPQDLLPNYSDVMTWDTLFSSLARYIFGTEAHIEVVATNIAAVRIKCEILGHVSSLRPDEHRYDMQVLTITSWSTEMHEYEPREWIVPASAISVKVGDIVSLLDGGHNIAILRSETEFFHVVTTSGRWNAGSAQYNKGLEKADKHELFLAWDWNSPEQSTPRFIDTIPAKSTIVQHTDVITRREAVVNALLDANLNTKAESSLLDLEQEYQQRSGETEFAEMDFSARIVYSYLRIGRLDEAERRYKDIYRQAKAMARKEWLSQSLSQYLRFFPTNDDHRWKTRILETLKSVIDKNLIPPQHYIQTHLRLTDILENCTAADASLLIDLGELLSRNPETSIPLADTRDNAGYAPEAIIKAVEEDVVKAAARNNNNPEIMELLLEKKGDQVLITEDVVMAAARNFWKGREVMELLFEKKGDQLPITEDVVKAAAGSFQGPEVIKLLLEKRGDQVLITEDVVKAAAGGKKVSKIMKLLLEKKGDQIPITEDVVKAVAGYYYSREVMELLFEKRGDQVPITENVVMAAAGGGNRGVMELLFEEKGDQVTITENVVMAAAGSDSWEVIKWLFEEKGDQVTITENVVMAAAGSDSGREVMELLFEKRGDQVKITENVVMAAAGSFQGPEVIKLLLEKRGDQVLITEDVVKAAAGGKKGRKVMELLFEKKGDQVLITEDVVKAAAGGKKGRKVMELLFEKRGDQVLITEDVVKAAAGNHFDGRRVMELLFEESTSLGTLNAVKSMALNKAAAAGSHEVVELLLEKDADLNIPDQDGRTPLVNASRNGRLRVVKQLSVRGADWRIPDSSGLDALQWAIREDRYDVQDFLLSVGAVESNDIYGFRALFEEELTVLS